MGWAERRALSALAGVASIAFTGVILATTTHHYSAAELVVLLAAGWAYVGSGILLWMRRPETRTGPLLMAVGLTSFVGQMWPSSDSIASNIGMWVLPLHLAFFSYVLLAFPTGKLDSTLSRAVVAVTFFDVIVLAHVRLVTDDLDLKIASAQAAFAVGAVVFLAAALLLVRRWLGGSKAWRRTVASVLWPAVISLAALSVYDINGFITTPNPPDPVALWIFRIAFALIPFAFLAVLLQVRLARASVAGLVVELEEKHSSDALRDALARALGDPTVAVAFWLPDENRYVDIAGHDVELPEENSGHVTTIVEHEGRHVAAIFHDEALADEPGLLRAVAAAAALALDNARLQAELRANVEELTASRRRMVHAAADERKRIEQNLRSPREQLTSMSDSLDRAQTQLSTDPTGVQESLREARATLAAALNELRDISQRIHPSAIADKGLPPAVEDLTYGTSLPVKLVIEPTDLGGGMSEKTAESAYFVVSEALTNVTKHAPNAVVLVQLIREGDALWVSIRDNGLGGADLRKGSGLSGLADRVSALGGTFTVDSRVGVGTVVQARIPCS